MASPELAVCFARPPRQLEWLAASPEERQERWARLLGDPCLAEWLASLSPTRLYLGSEFCEHLLPSKRELRAALELADAAGWTLALLTPIASPAVLHALEELLVLLPAATEVIVNDWGVAYLLRERFPALRAIAGRLLCRMVRDPRLPSAEWAHHCVDGLRSAHLLKAFERLGVTRLELDVPLFATADSFARLPRPAGVHLPFLVVAKGRLCRTGSLSLVGPERFAPGRRCRRECLHLAASMSRPQASADRHETVQLGNTLLARHSESMFAALQAAVAAGHVTRLIVPGEPL